MQLWLWKFRNQIFHEISIFIGLVFIRRFKSTAAGEKQPLFEFDPHSDRFKISARSLSVFMKENFDIYMLLRRWDGYVPRIRRYYRWAIAESPTRPVSSSPWRTQRRRIRRNRGRTRRPLGSCISGRWRRPTVAATCANSTPSPCWASWDAWMS